MTLLLAILAFFSGALPFSVWVGRYALKVDIRNYGDNNPGATNVLRAGGKGWYAFALFLDICKGAIPVGIAHQLLKIDGWPIVLIALMPPLGHALSPFLNWRGGKAVAAAFGSLIGLTLWQLAPFSMLFVIVWSLIIRPSGWALLAAMACLLALTRFANHPWEWTAVVIGLILIFIWKHTADLKQRPQRMRRNKQK